LNKNHAGLALRPVLGSGFNISDQVSSSFKTCLHLKAYPGVVTILKKGAARGLRGARPSSAFQLVLVADCEETEYHGRGMSMRVSLGSFSHLSNFSRASYVNKLLCVI